ncbi:open rectifier potassium channel protein 1 isoform X2 [Copidosoma floridanum]|uniref:open rectifier potassium channel protein 1 isoform X2 n=1 Tax=Copidosoma floridanum TaxID=29053 RepID=UPI0006C9504E|nr:open rectifier potassium channel protein 1 isoform X2 [Copidosoma floridanum]
MSKKQWLVLLMLFLLYLLLGASMFYHIESPLEVKHVHEARLKRIEIHSLLNEHYRSSGGHDQHEILEKLTKYCGKSVHNYSEGETDPLKWDFYNSFYFAYTVVSTIGYGNLAPTNPTGRVLMIFYALIGIPINGILLSQLGEFFSETFVSAVRRYKAYKKNRNEYSKSSLNSLEKQRFSLAVQILTYLIPGFVMFIFFPAFLFSYYEHWSYDEAVYYAFVTLTTIGFGDYVAGQDNEKGNDILFGVYKIFLIVWISFGLGYIVMIMTFIGRGMTSKKVARLEHKLALKLKHTQSKIWNEFNEDINYLRRVFNELQFSKVKRVYVDEYDYDTPTLKFPRSISFPNLRELVYGGLDVQIPPQPRRRANSEVVPMEESHVARVVSETDLQRIDKNATFATHAMVQPAELLARLVNILGYIPPPPDDDEALPPDSNIGVGSGVTGGGIQGFSEKEILASEAPPWNSEKETAWKLGGDTPKSYRSRAHSEVRLDRPELFVHPSGSEWTWSDPAASTKIKEIMRARKSMPSNAKEAASKTRFLSRAGLGLPKMKLPRWISAKKPDQLVDPDTDPVDAVLAAASNQPPQMPDGPRRRNSYFGTHFTHTGASSLLEETSVADFLRALTALHTRVGGVPDDLVAAAAATRKTATPQRKLGTASLTPPKLPSLVALFSPPGAPLGHSQSQQNTVTGVVGKVAQAGRRFSLRTAENSSNTTPLYQRRLTQGAPPILPSRPRRFSLRQVTSSVTPQQYSSNPGQQLDGASSPPAYSSGHFVLDNPKGHLATMRLPGTDSLAVMGPRTGRRFSLRPAQIGVPPAPSNASIGQPVKPVAPRWRAGMLQRQIVQQNARRKVQRAFSLSDVHSDERERNIGISPLALHDNARTITSVQGQRLATSTAGKTVTIVSPGLSRTRNSEPRGSSEAFQQGSGRFGRYNSDIESVSSKSSSQSSRSLDRELAKTSDASLVSSRKSSFGAGNAMEDDEWDFPPTNEEGDVGKPSSNDRILKALLGESRRTSSGSSRDEEVASATTQSSTVSTETLSSVPSFRLVVSQHGDQEEKKSDEVRIDVPEDS